MSPNCGGIVAKLWHVPGLFHVLLHGCYAPSAYRSWFVPVLFSVCSAVLQLRTPSVADFMSSPCRLQAATLYIDYWFCSMVFTYPGKILLLDDENNS